LGLHNEHAGSVDVTVANPRDLLYIRGNEITEGSIRFHFIGDPGETFGHIELRDEDVWNDTGLTFSSGSINLGRDLSVSAVGEFLQTFLASVPTILGTRNLHGHIPYHPDTGTEPNPGPAVVFSGMPFMPVLNPPMIMDVFPPFIPDNDITGTSISIIFPELSNRVIRTSQHSVGATGATAEVEITFTQDGVVLSRFRIPASQMQANTSVFLEFTDEFGLAGTNIVQTFTSVNDISLNRNVSNEILTRHDAFPQSTQDIILEEFVIGIDEGPSVLDILNPTIIFTNEASFVVNNRFQ